MTFKELIEESSRRGLTYMLDGGTKEARLKRWINDAYREVSDEAAWPFREVTKEGKAPLTIEDASHVLSFIDATNKEDLRGVDRRTLLAADPALTATGFAEYWYREGSSTFKVYPADTSSTFSVIYLKSPKELKEATDTPIFPTNYHEIIIDGTVIRGLKDQNNWEAMAQLRGEWRASLGRMKKELLPVNYANAETTQRTGTPGDYL